MPAQAKKFSYKGQFLTIKEIEALPECQATANCLYWRITQLKQPVEEAIAKPGRGRSTTVVRYFYKGRDYTTNELSELPECVVSYKTLQQRLKTAGWSVSKALRTPVDNSKGWRKKKLIENGQANPAETTEAMQKRKIREKREREEQMQKNKKIFETPVNPRKSVYLAMALRRF